MAKLLKLRRGTTTQHASFTGAEGEVTIDTTKDTAVVHDGSQAGGRPLAREDMSNVSSASIAGRLGTDSLSTSMLAGGALPSNVTVASTNINNGSIVNDDVNASAAIAGTKISPDFGTQQISSGNITVLSNVPNISFVDGNDNPDYKISANSGALNFEDITNNANRLTIQSDGTVDVQGNLDANAGIDVTGNITNTGTITSTGDITIANNSPKLIFTDNDNNSDFRMQINSGNFVIEDTTNSNADRFQINSSGTVDVFGNLDVGAGIDVTGDVIATGDLKAQGGDVRIEGTSPGLHLTDTDNNDDFFIYNNNGTFKIYDATDGVDRFKINSAGTCVATGNLDVGAGIDVTGNMTVTGTVDGRDVAADGTKLDGIESGATADQTGPQIASLLNGQDVLTTGIIGRDSTDYFSFTNNTRVDLFVNNSNEFRFENDGDFHADGDVIAQSTTISSDRRLKENIQVVPNALDKVEALNGVTFDWKRDGTPSAGVIAQEVQEVLPEAVKEVTPVKGGDSHLSVNYHALTSILIESIKELKAEIEELKGGK